MKVCRFTLLAESNLAGGGWVKATGVGGPGVTCGGLAGAGGDTATGLGLITEATI